MRSAVFFALALFATAAVADSATPTTTPNSSSPNSSTPNSSSLAPLRVGYSPIVPYFNVTNDDRSAPVGFEVDVVNDVAASLDRKVVWVPSRNVGENLEKLGRGEVDVAAGAISITGAREAVYDFTYPVVRDGLGILIRSAPASPSAMATISGLFTRSRLAIFGGFLLLIIVAGNLVWLAERGGPSFSQRYFPGVFEGMYFAIVTASTVGYGDKSPVRWPGRVISSLVIIVSLPMFAIFTAELASAITLQSVAHATIEGPKDLGSRHVAAVKNTTSAAWVSEQNARLRAVDDFDDAVAALRNSDVDAVVYDAAAIRALVSGDAGSGLAVVDGTWDLHDIGFVVAEGSALREPLNRRLLAIEEQGTVERLHLRWFGTEE